MTRDRLDGLYLLILGSAVFVLLGVALEANSQYSMVDFKSLFYGTKCLIHHGDPFRESELLRTYQAEGGDNPSDSAIIRRIATEYGNLPTAFSFILPLAILPWGLAHVLWMTVTAGSLILAAFLMWSKGADHAPLIAGVLAGFLVANSELVLIVGNAAGIVVGLCAIAVWCFLEERFVWAGVLCLAVSLAIKPHDAGLVWLFFLLAGGVYRKRALQTLLVSAGLSFPALVWVWRVAPNWMQELSTNLAGFSAHGDIADPGLASMGVHGLGMMINLQTVIYVFQDNPHIYNLISYVVVGVPVLVWMVVTLRTRSTPAGAWLALAAIAALSMLPVYHRQYDAKLLLLTIPACAALWTERGLAGWLALALTAAGFVFTGDLSCAILIFLTNSLHLSSSGMPGQILNAIQVFPAPLLLLAMGIFYTWVYARRSFIPDPSIRSEGREQTPALANGASPTSQN